MTMRTAKTEAEYQKAKKSGTLIPLGLEVQKPNTPDFVWWKVIKNRFPHDKHYVRHDLVVLRRDCMVHQLTVDELRELYFKIIPWADDSYDVVKFNLSSMRSVDATIHFHLASLIDELR